MNKIESQTYASYCSDQKPIITKMQPTDYVYITLYLLIKNIYIFKNI